MMVVKGWSLPHLITSSVHARPNADSSTAQQRAIVYYIMHVTPVQIYKLISPQISHSYRLLLVVLLLQLWNYLTRHHPIRGFADKRLLLSDWQKIRHQQNTEVEHVPVSKRSG